MKSLLRSVFVASGSDDPALLTENVRLLETASFVFPEPEDAEIWEFVKGFVQRHSHVPESSTIQQHFEQLRKDSVVDRLAAVRISTPKVRGDFLLHLEARAEERRKALLSSFLQSASDIVSRGLTIQEGREKKTLLGPMDAMHYLMDKSTEILTPTLGSRLSGDVTKDGQAFLERYDRIKNDPSAGLGCMMGIQQVDVALQGAKPAELWTHAAFTGGLKSTVALNWAYTQAMYYGQNSLFFSLEMTYTQIHNLIVAMHSMHEKFANVHPPLDYQDIKHARLSQSEEWFLKDYVIPDLEKKDQYGHIHIEMRNPGKLDVTVEDIRSRAQSMYSKMPYSIIFVDHAGLMTSRKYNPSTTERLNEVIADCKRTAMGFNRGQGIAMVLLFQISREGYRSALKARGLQSEGRQSESLARQKTRVVSDYVYNLSHLSYSSECERSSDIVTTTWLDDELSSKGQVLFQCLKSRDQKPFEPFKAHVHWGCRRLSTLIAEDAAEAAAVGAEIDFDSME